MSGGRRTVRTKGDEQESRVQFIMDMMRKLEFVRGKNGTGPKLADEWGLAYSTVRNMTAEAWRRVCAEATDCENTKGTVCVTLDESLQRAFKGAEYRSVASLADVWTRIVGAQAPKRVDATVTSIDRSDPDALARKYEAMARALRAGTEED